MPLSMALFLSTGIALGHLAFLDPPEAGGRGILGGPAFPSPEKVVFEEAAPAILPAPLVSDQNTVIDEVGRVDVVEEGARLQASTKALGNFSDQVGIIPYRVKKGDTLSGIARDFRISVQTIIEANPKVKANALQIGQDLNILPVSGIVYTVQEGETLESISSLFRVPPAQIQEVNHSVSFGNLKPGTALVIPGVKSAYNVTRATASLPELKEYFIRPAEGFNWGKLHSYNAVDVANSCGAQVVAAAEGLVIDGAEEGWNSGYGHYLLLEHPNGTQTRYAHLGALTVSVGDYVKQGDFLGAMGNTGNVHGETGCHVHFEVVGAQNPFAR